MVLQVLSFLFRKRVYVGNWTKTIGHTGFIENTKLNNFSIRAPDNHIVVIPNKKITDNPIKNYSLTSTMHTTIVCGLGYESDLEMVEQLTKESIYRSFKQEGRDKEKVLFFYTAFGSTSISFICHF